MTKTIPKIQWEQLLQAVNRLPIQYKVMLWRKLRPDVEASILQKFDQALAASWQAHRDFTEEEVMADALQTIAEIRSSRRSAGSA